MSGDGIVTVEAAEDLKRGAAVELNGNDKAELTDGNGDVVFGICLTPTDKATSGKDVAVQTQGAVMALLDGSGTSLAHGDQLMPKSSAQSGKLVAHAGNAGDAYVGKVISPNIDGTSDGERGRIRLYGDRTRTS